MARIDTDSEVHPERDSDSTDIPSLSLAKSWARVRARLRSEFGEADYRNWLQGLTLVGLKDGCVTLSVSSRFARDRVQTHFADRLRALWQIEARGVENVKIVLAQHAKAAADKDEAALEVRQGIPDDLAAEEFGGTADLASPSIRSARQNEDDGVSAPLDARFTFDNFVVGKPNELAFAAARRVAESDNAPFNPLFLYGGVGLGKTHLMHAIAWSIRTLHPERRVLFLSAEAFMYQFIRALRFKDTDSFKEQFRSVDVLMIDDLQFISGKDSTQEEFFHTFNTLVDNNRQVIVSADKSPNDLDGVEERLRSRLGWGLVADVHPTDYELRLGILQAKAEKLKSEIPAKVLEFLAHKISSNVRELEGALNRIVAHAELVGRAISLENTQEVLHDVLKANDRRITIEDIQRKVASHYHIRVSDMHSPRRARAVARPRQIAMYLSKQLTQRSLPEIGRKFGNRDHTTVMHAVKKVEELRLADRQFDEDVDMLKRMLES